MPLVDEGSEEEEEEEEHMVNEAFGESGAPSRGERGQGAQAPPFPVQGREAGCRPQAGEEPGIQGTWALSPLLVGSFLPRASVSPAP